MNDLTKWLPTTKKEVELRGWDYLDVILFSGDAYVDHPSFGIAVVGRLLESLGLRVAIVPQPNWRDDLRDFKKLGIPRLFFGVSAGVMDSMVNKYTANKRIRSEDAYSPEGRNDLRPDYPTIVYSNILKILYPDIPVIIGGIEASLRRFTHYDYWEDKLRPTILLESKADLLVYGMGELPLKEIVKQLLDGRRVGELKNIPQTAYLTSDSKVRIENSITLHSHDLCLVDKRKQAENFRIIEEESNKIESETLLQLVNEQLLVVNPPYSPMTTEEIDASCDMPYTRLPHPKYKEKHISAYEMIKFSVNIHRGCFGGCSFCTISAHQGKHVASRSKESIMREVAELTKLSDFKGNLSDLGGPSANMYMMFGKDRRICLKCKKPSCIYPIVCKNLNTDHSPLINLYKSVEKINGIKKVFIGSGLRYDLMLHQSGDTKSDSAAKEYTRTVICKHVSGRLKVAPEHTSESVLKQMRKPSFKLFHRFNELFNEINRREGLKQQLIPYFISSHPGCTVNDMKELASITNSLNFNLEQVQDFTPTPMTLATEMFYTGLNPYTLEPVYTAKTKEEKLAQRSYFFKKPKNSNEKKSYRNRKS